MSEIESRLAALEKWAQRHEVATCEHRKVEFEPGGTLEDIRAGLDKRAADKKAADDLMRPARDPAPGFGDAVGQAGPVQWDVPGGLARALQGRGRAASARRLLGAGQSPGRR